MINHWKNIAYWEEWKQSKLFSNKSGLHQVKVVWSGCGSSAPRKLYNFFSNLSLEIAFTALEFTQNWYVSMSIFFFRKWQVNYKCGPLQAYHAGRLSPQSEKIWNQGGLKKSQFPKFLLNWKKFGSRTQAYIKKEKQLGIFLNWEKLRSALRETFKNLKISLWIWKNFELQYKVNTQKSQFRIYGRIGKILGNLSFTVKNKIWNLYRIRLYTF